MGEKDNPGDLSTGGYVNGVPYRLMRLRMLVTGTNAPDEEAWAEGLGRLLVHLSKFPLGIRVQAELSEKTLQDIEALAIKRGVDGNVIISQAINTLLLLQENMGPEDELLIRKMDGTFQKVIFS